MMRRASLALALLVGLAGARVGATERRCGWLENPTPQNYWLEDRSGQWTLSEQGGYVAGGFDDDSLPDLGRPRGSWVVTNASSYGYGCACVTGTWKRRTMQAIRITGWTRHTLAHCRADKRLPRL